MSYKTFISAVLLSSLLQADEGLQIPEPFRIPQETVQRLAFVPAKMSPIGDIATPLQSSVIVDVQGVMPDGTKRGGLGSGTFVGPGLVLTAEHVGRGLQDRTFTVIHNGVKHAAKLVREDREIDLSLWSIEDKSLPFVKLAEKSPQFESEVFSIGGINGVCTEWTHYITRVDQVRLQTTGRQIEGRSGGGLFYRDKLCGVIQARSNTENWSEYANTETVRKFVGDIHPVGTGSPVEWLKYNKAARQKAEDTGKNMLVVISADWCIPCRGLKKTLKTPEVQAMLDGFVCVEIDSDKEQQFVADFGSLPIPTMIVVTPEYKSVKSLVGSQTSETILSTFSEFAKTPEPVGAVGSATIEGWQIVRDSLTWLESVAGDGAKASFKLIRKGGAKSFTAGQKLTREQVLGTSGRVELSVETSAKIPVKSIAFDYEFRNGKPFVRSDWVQIELPNMLEDSKPQPAGSIIATAFIGYEILAWGYTAYELFSPTISLWPGDTIQATATLKGGELTVDLGPKPPAIHADWSLCFGFITVEYQRALTGFVLGQNGAVVQFHQSRVFRDVKVVGK